MYDQQPMLNYTYHLECANRNAISFKTEGMVSLLQFQLSQPHKEE